MDEDETLAAIHRIQQDFEEQTGPFADVTFPEERLLDELPNASMEETLVLVSMFSTFDYNRDANQLVDNIIELYNTASVWFNPLEVVGGDLEKLQAVMELVGFRYPNRDAQAWFKNCGILSDKYHGKWHELLLDTGLSAPRLVERLNDDDFNCLKGVKIAPMYARIIDDEVCELTDLWKLDIPVDTHIRRLSTDLFKRYEGEHWYDDEIRELWRIYGQREGVERHVVDGALWHIGNKWNEWGEDYWNGIME